MTFYISRKEKRKLTTSMTGCHWDSGLLNGTKGKNG
jgi:hypothetical protein